MQGQLRRFVANFAGHPIGAGERLGQPLDQRPLGQVIGHIPHDPDIGSFGREHLDGPPPSHRPRVLLGTLLIGERGLRSQCVGGYQWTRLCIR